MESNRLLLMHKPALLVETPQPTSNPNQLLNQKQLFLQRLMEDEMIGLAFLLLLI